MNRASRTQLLVRNEAAGNGSKRAAENDDFEAAFKQDGALGSGSLSPGKLQSAIVWITPKSDQAMLSAGVLCRERWQVKRFGKPYV